MTTIVPGLVKIGKTGSENFEQRIYNLERNGYVNVVVLLGTFGDSSQNPGKKLPVNRFFKVDRGAFFQHKYGKVSLLSI